MKRFALLVLGLSLTLLAPGCASPKKPAEAALAQAVTAWNAIKQQVLDVMPDEAPPIEAAIADATAKLTKGDYQGALTAATDLVAKVKSVGEMLEARTNELTAKWKEISGGMPATIAKLQDKLKGFKPLPAGTPGIEESPQGQFAKLRTDWDAAQSAMLNGHLADAVAKATAVRDLAVKLLTDLQDGS